MKILYLIQTHKNPDQIYRLVKTIRKSSSSSVIVISHDSAAAPLDLAPLNGLPGEPIQCLYAKSGRGDLSLVLAYLEALEWIYNQKIEFDWLVNLSGQCYPTQPLQHLHQFLTTTEYDGFLEHFELFVGDVPWSLQTSRDRYLYHYWRSGIQLDQWQRATLKPLKMIINSTQPLIRMHWYNDELMLGRRVPDPFSHQLIGYGGSYFHILSSQCVQFLYHFSNSDSGKQLIEFYKKAWVPVESVLQTVLINYGAFKFCNHNKRYMNWTKTSYGHPGIVTSENYGELTDENIFFARKFDIKLDSEILDRLDQRIFSQYVSQPSLG
jgi:hypothetical protein